MGMRDLRCETCGQKAHRDDAMERRCNGCEMLVRHCNCNKENVLNTSGERIDLAVGDLMTEIHDRQERAKELVRKYVLDRVEKTDPTPVFDVYIVWFCKTLQNWKSLISTTLPDGMYYEVTHNGDKNETYIDVYKKFDNVTIPGFEGVWTP